MELGSCSSSSSRALVVAHIHATPCEKGLHGHIRAVKSTLGCAATPLVLLNMIKSI